MSRLTTDEKLISQGKTCECIAAIAQRLADFIMSKAVSFTSVETTGFL